MEVAGGISCGSQSARTETEPSEITFKQLPEVIPLFQSSIFVDLTFRGQYQFVVLVLPWKEEILASQMR